MITTINGKKYYVSKLNNIEHISGSYGIMPYFLQKIESFCGDYYKATFVNHYGEAITRVVYLF